MRRRTPQHTQALWRSVGRDARRNCALSAHCTPQARPSSTRRARRSRARAPPRSVMRRTSRRPRATPSGARATTARGWPTSWRTCARRSARRSASSRYGLWGPSSPWHLLPASLLTVVIAKVSVRTESLYRHSTLCPRHTHTHAIGLTLSLQTAERELEGARAAQGASKTEAQRAGAEVCYAILWQSCFRYPIACVPLTPGLLLSGCCAGRRPGVSARPAGGAHGRARCLCTSAEGPLSSPRPLRAVYDMLCYDQLCCTMLCSDAMFPISTPVALSAPLALR
jgi:hypothetical protein